MARKLAFPTAAGYQLTAIATKLPAITGYQLMATAYQLVMYSVRRHELSIIEQRNRPGTVP